MRLVADASPLIFLGKIGRLGLVRRHGFRIGIEVYEAFVSALRCR